MYLAPPHFLFFLYFYRVELLENNLTKLWREALNDHGKPAAFFVPSVVGRHCSLQYNLRLCFSNRCCFVSFSSNGTRSKILFAFSRLRISRCFSAPPLHEMHRGNHTEARPRSLYTALAFSILSSAGSCAAHNTPRNNT